MKYTDEIISRVRVVDRNKGIANKNIAVIILWHYGTLGLLLNTAAIQLQLRNSILALKFSDIFINDFNVHTTYVSKVHPTIETIAISHFFHVPPVMQCYK